MPLSTLPNPQAFYEQVWALVRLVPYGRVITYGQVAGLVSAPPGVEPEQYATFGARWVGAAMAASPNDVPWQRVINSQGKISQRPGALLQRQLLEDEQVEFVNDKLDMKKYRWHPGEDDQPRQARLL